MVIEKSAFSLSSQPEGQKWTAGTNVTVFCSIDTSRVSSRSVVWFIRTGSMRFKLGSGSMRYSNFVDNKRYSLGVVLNTYLSAAPVYWLNILCEFLILCHYILN